MANIKFSQFTQKTTLGTVDFLVGYTGADNVQIDPADLLSDYSQGTGAAGQVTFFSATSTVTGDNDFYWNNANKRLGIGISSPNRLLHVNSNGQTDIHLTTNSQGTSASDGMTVFLDAAGSGGLWLRENADIRFATSGTERVRIKDGGNVGIGTTSPAAKLEVNGTLIATGISQLGSGGSNVYLTSSSAGNVGIGTNSPGVKLEVAKGSEGDYLIVGGDNASNSRALVFTSSTATSNGALHTINAQSGNGVIAFSTASTERMRITSGGNIILGANGNQYGLVTIRQDGTSNDNGLAVVDPSNQKSARLWSDSTNIYLSSGATGTGVLVLNEGGGNVGIGTTSPQRRLTVGDGSGSEIISIYAGNTNASAVHFTDTNTSTDYQGFVSYNHSSDALRFGTAEVERMRINSSGNVGIGTTSADAKLDITQSSATVPVIRLTDDGVANYDFIFPDSSTIKLEVNTSSDKTFKVLNAGSGAFNLEVDGNIKLSGNGTSNDSYPLTFTNGACAIARDGNNLDLHAYDKMIFGVSNTSYPTSTERMRINSSGKVGIGTTSPASKLNIETTKTVALSAAADFLTLGLTVDDSTAGNTAGGGGGIAFRSKNDNSGTQVVFGAIDAIKESANVSDFRGSLRFFTNQNSTGVPLERMRINSSGDLLFGTTGTPNGTSVYGSAFLNTTNERMALVQASDTTSLATMQTYYNPNGAVGTIKTTGSATQFNTSSDYRLKEDLKDFDGLDKVSKIPVYNFKWKVDDSRSYGVMAHELQEVLPDAVSGEKDAEEMQGVDYSKIVPLLIKSIQELEAKVKELESK